LIFRGAVTRSVCMCTAVAGSAIARIAAELDPAEPTINVPNSAPDGCVVSLVLDQDHEALLREWFTSAARRLLVTSHRVGPAAEMRLAAAPTRLADEGVEYRAFYGQTFLDGDQQDGLAEEVARAGGVFTHLPGLHAKALIKDDQVCISSYDFLSADPFGRATRARELGVVIRSPAISNVIWQEFASVAGSPSAITPQ
jgi:hypothetical protein